MVEKAGLYIHIPFCIKRCNYCDFTSYTSLNFVNNYIDALKKEIELRKSEGEKYIFDSIYIGGGTPSILNEENLDLIFNVLYENYHFSNNIEISIEANPESITTQKLKSYKSFKINRLSIGVQSFDDKLLKSIERIHNSHKAYKSINLAREAGFNNLNIDLIAGLPISSEETFDLNIEAINKINPEHISIYLLMISKKTKLLKLIKNKTITLPNEKEVRNYWEKYVKFLKSNNYTHYEISNFSKKNYECRHNLHYWLREPYIGFGVSATSFLSEFRLTNTKNLNLYIDKINNGLRAITIKEKIDEEKRKEETIMLNLRLLCKGINKNYISEKNQINIEKFKKLKLIKEEEDFLYLTEKGVLLSNQVISDFI